MKLKLVALMIGLTSLQIAPVLAQAPYREQAQDPHQHEQEIDPALLIKAKTASELLAKNKALFIDVRSRPEFNAEHIQGALSYPYTVIKTAKDLPFKPADKVILYCGCPHHLSGLSAEILKTKGFKDVHVIDEGYWGWKEFGFPIMLNPDAPSKLSMDVEGIARQNGQALAYKDVFLLHPETGQLEATRTDREGNFRMALHFRGVDLSDQVVFQIQDQDLQRLSLAALKSKFIELELPQQVASR